MQQVIQSMGAGQRRFNSVLHAGAEPDVTRLRVLIADKDDKNRALLSRLLEGQGFTVVGTAASTCEALSLLKKTPPHLLLVGIKGPGEQSLQLVRQAKAQSPDLGVTVLMDTQDFTMVGQLLESGASAVLAAPVDSTALFSELRRAGNRCVAKLATRCILAFKAPESERHVRALPSQCEYPAGPQLVDLVAYA